VFCDADAILTVRIASAFATFQGILETRSGGAGNLEQCLSRVDADCADFGARDVTATTDEGQQPARIGVLATPDIHLEPDGILKALTWTLFARIFTRTASRCIEHFLDDRHFRTVNLNQCSRDVLGGTLGHQALRQCLVFLVRFDRSHQCNEQTFAIVVADVCRRRCRRPFGSDLCIAQHRFDATAAGMRDDQDSGALLSGATCTTRAMLQGIGIARQFDVNDQRQRRQIDTARGNVGRDANPGTTITQRLKRVVAFVLAMLTRQGDGGKATLDQAGVEVTDIVAGRAEQHRRFGFVEAQQVDDGMFDVGRRNRDGAVADVAMTTIFTDGRDAQRIVLVTLCQCHDRLWHRCREHEGATFFWRCVEDLFQIFAETHVEHFIGFIEHGDLQRAEVESATLEVIAEATRRADDYVRAMRKVATLFRGIHAADAGCDARTGLAIKPHEFAADLKRKLTGRGDHERQWLQREGDTPVFIEHLGSHGEAKRDGLSRTRLRGHDKIASCGFGFEDGGLNGCRGGIAVVGERFGEKRWNVSKFCHAGAPTPETLQCRAFPTISVTIVERCAGQACCSCDSQARSAMVYADAWFNEETRNYMIFKRTLLALSAASTGLMGSFATAQDAPVNLLPDFTNPASPKPQVNRTLPPIPMPRLSEAQESTLTNWLADVAAPGLARTNPAATATLTGDALVTQTLDRARAIHAGRLDTADFLTIWALRPAAYDPMPSFAEAVSSDRVSNWIANLAPPYSGYDGLRRGLVNYRAIKENGGWRTIPAGPPMSIGQSDTRIPALRQRLALEDRDVVTKGAAFDATLREAVQRAQRRYGLNPTGSAGPETLAALNVSVDDRIGAIMANMERWRWLPAELPTHRIQVNIAAAVLTVFEGDRPVTSMRAVTGRPGDETPMLQSNIRSIVINPPWNVPTSIATRELWPKERANKGYLAAHNFKVIGTPETGQRLQQAAGSTSALGRLKFDFDNPFSVYLHDTPSRAKFSSYSRLASHGCVRLEKPLDLAELVLKDDPKWQGDAIQEAIDAGPTQRVALPQQVAVYLLYWTAFASGNGQMNFRDDPYGWDKLLASKIEASTRRAAVAVAIQG
jgi:murein L,D-transpeptidase YcbB/YkuD